MESHKQIPSTTMFPAVQVTLNQMFNFKVSSAEAFWISSLALVYFAVWLGLGDYKFYILDSFGTGRRPE